MQTEIEAKFPNIDAKKFRAKLKKLGAKLGHPELSMKRKTFDLPGGALGSKGAWVRVRDEGDKITLSYKQLKDRSLHGTSELTVNVTHFEDTCKLMEHVGLVPKSYQETKREKWFYKKVEITIDTWPWVPTVVELEGPSEKVVRAVAKELDLNWDEVMHGSVEPVYQLLYDFTDEEICHWESITFTKPPKWLLARKKNTKKK
ncbi:MAG: CYTH domain-containing protein [Candidatus Taylorbacteria bacterium]